MRFTYDHISGAVRYDTDDILRAEDRRRIEASARRGAKLLDQKRPGWFRPHVLALSRLDLADCEVCVLGQVYSGRDIVDGFTRGCDVLFGFHPSGRVEHGFDLSLSITPKSTAPFSSRLDGYERADVTHEAGFVVLQAEWERQIRARRKAKAAA